MQIQIFTIPVFHDSTLTEEMNRFLRAHTVIDVERQFIENGNNSCWTFCIRFMATEKKDSTGSTEKVDYKEILEPVIFDKFSILRQCRKEVAEKHGVPIYLVFTNEELANIARLPAIGIGEVKKTSGLSKTKMEKYGKALIELYQQKSNETANQPNDSDS